MKNTYSSVNLYIGTSEGVDDIPEMHRQHALIVVVDELRRIARFEYQSPVSGVQDIFSALLNPKQLFEQIDKLAKQRGCAITPVAGSCQLLHLRPEDIQNIFQESLVPYLKPEEIYAQLYFDRHADAVKFDRKMSGLSHSFMKSDVGLIELANKRECRVICMRSTPTRAIFDNLPENTSAAFVLVESADKSVQSDIYYLENQQGSTPQWMAQDSKKVDFFRSFALSNRGLTKEELQTYHLDQYHQLDGSNVYGEGGFAKVKKSEAIVDGVRAQYATKIQKIKQTMIKTKLTDTKAQQAQLQNEAMLTGKVYAGTSSVSIHGNKLYFHMHAKGSPLVQALANCPFEQKLEYAILFLLVVNGLHEAGIAHRDIKLANTLLDQAAGVCLVDFGLATTHLADKTEQLGGSLIYASLDQALINYYCERLLQYEENDTSGSLATVAQTHDDMAHSNISDTSEDVDTLLDDWSEDLDEVISSDESVGTYNQAQSLPQDWHLCMSNAKYCVTRNYVEDDKVAAMRTIYCQPNSMTKGSIFSIFDTEEFLSLPTPIQNIFDTTTIAPIFAEERSGEAVSFLAAVLICYQKNQAKSDEYYTNFIHDARQNKQLIRDMITQYQRLRIDPVKSTIASVSSLQNIEEDKSVVSERSPAIDVRKRKQQEFFHGKKYDDTTQDDVENIMSQTLPASFPKV